MIDYNPLTWTYDQNLREHSKFKGTEIAYKNEVIEDFF